MENKRIIAVIGASVPTEDEYQAAYRVGQLLAERGALLICGGMGGVMEAACRAAQMAGGVTIGLLPGSDPGDANAFVSIPIATGLGEMRNGLIVRACESAIAIGGGAGTLAEIALAVKAGKRVLGLTSFSIQIHGEETDFILHVKTPEEAVDLALGSSKL